ncbi:unnamed protein product [Amoebophrya sp. A25]|nr:unnamed protein product [Amoebophrya sp. A25]|eukprot:GSA25T00021056001.1
MQTFDEIRGPGGNKRSSSFFECERGCTFKFLVQTFILIQTLRESDSYKDVRLFAGRLSGGAASTDQTSAPQAATTPDPASKPVAANSLELDVDAVTEKAELVAAEALMDVTRVPPVAAPAVVQKAPTEVVQQAALATTAPPPALTNPGESFGMAAFTSGKDVLSFTIPDADTITFSAWIYLPEIPGDAMPSESQSIKTIASTKTSGCESTPDSFGWAFFVHEWGSLNQQLRLQWTVAGTACLELRAKALVKYNKWQLVGFSFSGKRAMMYVGKQLVADSDAAEGDFFARGASYSGPLWPRDEANRATDKLFIGGFRPEAQGMHGFMGYMLDIRYYAHSWGTDAKQFFDFSTTRMDDAVAPDKKNLLDKTKVKAHIQFKQAPGPVENRITGEPGVAQSLMNPQQQGAPAPLFKSVPYVEKPDLSWIPKGPVSDINEITDVTPRPVLSDAEIKGAWPSRWTDKFSAEDLMKSQREADLMAEEVRKEMVHCWRGYKSTAWGRDEVRPVTGGGHNWVSIGITILDSLDTIYLMDLQQEFAEGEDFVRNLDFAAVRSGYHSLFEVTIRGLGGLLSAFSLSGHDIFLTKAADLGQRLMRAFVLESGLPKPQIDLASGGSRWVNWASGTNIAEVGTLQLEYRFLAAHTKRQEFWTTPDKAFMKIVENSENVGKGLVPIFLGSKQASAASGFFGSKISLGAMGDSYYEYLIKQYIQNGKRDTRYKNLFVKAMNEMMDRLIVKTNRGTIFVAEENGGRRLDRMDHLACFVSGMLLLGVMELPQSDVDPRWFPAAEGIAETCYKMYKLARTGLSPEYVKFDVNAKEGQPDIILPPDGAHNLLRPEAIEAIYYMWYYTGDPKYRVWAREMFLAFKKHSKAKYGYTALRDVRNPTIRSNQQESFWMAETMKYFYLIFSPRQRLDLHEWVLSTEAHPFKMPIEMPKGWKVIKYYLIRRSLSITHF